MGDNYEIYEHRQFCDEISYVVSGNCSFFVDNKELRAKKGDIHLIRKGVQHRILVGKNEQVRMAYIGFTLQRTDGDELQAFYDDPPACMLNDQYFMRALFDQLLNEVYRGQIYCQEAMEAGITQILIYVWRLYQHQGHNETIRNVEETRLEHVLGHSVLKILRYIDNNIGKINEINEIANELKYNPSYLSRIFKNKMGVTLSEYICARKMEKAKELLDCGEKICDISEYLGYASSKSFYKAFHRSTGSSPTEYKNR